ncbi:MAG: TRAP transporter substrate-binding protein [Deltaproteobacteria bacterium]|nr:TRAP transporter substrate-binding protein [Deltaproteobacteria bacterium]
MLKLAKLSSRFAALLALAGILLTLVPVAGAESLTLNYANFPPAPTFPCVQMERWAKEVESRSHGQIKVMTFPGGTLLGAKNMLDGVKKGIADIGCFCPPYLPGRFPLLEGADLPVGFTSAAVASATLWDLYEKYRPESLNGVKVLTMFTCAPANLMLKTAGTTLADLKGMEIRGTGISGRYLEAMGAIPVAMPMSAVPEALQKGVVKGVFSSLEIMQDFKFAELCDHVTIINGPTTSFAVVMNLEKWQGLSPEIQKIFNDLGREQALWTGNYEDNHVKEALAWSEKTHQVKINSIAPAEKSVVSEKVRFMTDAYLNQTAKAGLPGREFLEDLMTFKAKYEKEF